MKSKIVIADLDGTIALDHKRAKRHLHLKCECHKESPTKMPEFSCPKCRGKGLWHNWDDYFAECLSDEVNEPVVEILRALSKKYEIRILSGRSAAVEEKTIEWLRKHDVPYDIIKLRPVDNRVDDHVLKVSWVKGFERDILFVLEDRQRVVDAWRREGFTCLQVAPGNF